MTAATLCVEYRLIEGNHIFTSKDVKGLYVASKNAEKALNGLPGIIKKLFKYNHNIECEVQPLALLRDLVKEEVPDRPVEVSNKEYLLQVA